MPWKVFPAHFSFKVAEESVFDQIEGRRSGGKNYDQAIEHPALPENSNCSFTDFHRFSTAYEQKSISFSIFH